VRSDRVLATPFAHRGLHDAATPENSLPAFRAAVAAGYGNELDVRLTADGRLAVVHDATTLRTTGVDLRVAGTDARTLSRLRLEGTAHRVPMLDDVLDEVGGRTPLLVEVKTCPRWAVASAAVARLVAGYRGPVAVQSFDPRVVGWLRRNAPAVTRGQLAGGHTAADAPPLRRFLLDAMAANAATRPHFLGYRVEDVPHPAVTAWQRVLDVPLLLWTVRTRAQLDVAARLGASPIFEGVRPRPVWSRLGAGVGTVGV
jgi:glycerophosphoryl diester phosphodiesterase